MLYYFHPMSTISFRAHRLFIVLVAFSTIFCALVYASVQQVLRQDANDPQIQLAEDITAAINKGNDPTAVLPPGSFDVSQSLATFALVFDASGTQIAGSGQINAKNIAVPSGVFAYVQKHGEDRFTWQTSTGQRFAAVATSYAGKTAGTVVVARSLREVEVREMHVEEFAAIAWLLCVILAGLFSWSLAVTMKKQSAAHV